MICNHCGKSVDDDASVCPFCGSAIDAARTESFDPVREESPMLPPLSGRRGAEEPRAEIRRESPSEGKGRGVFTPALAFSLLSFALSLACLLTILSLRGSIRTLNDSLTGSIASLGTAVNAANDRLDQLDSTLARVQSDAYEQVASQSISITKDITPLTGPVDEGRYNQMFIVKAKGNLNVDTAFVWQRYNEATGGWVEIVFTGDATTNEQFGLRLENQRDAATGEFTSILWAQGITAEAAGTYRCVITDAGGFTKTSAEATVSIKSAEE